MQDHYISSRPPRWSTRHVGSDFLSRVKTAACDRWPLVLRTLGIPPATLDGRRHRCFHCGGSFRFFDDGTGRFVCSGSKGRRLAKGWDGFALLTHCGGFSFPQAVRAVAGTLGVSEMEPELPAAGAR
jgi:phage/plasmid primase-like uncharacterized protein